MAYTTHVTFALRRVSNTLNDMTPQFTGWSQIELVDYLNDAQTAIAKYVPRACSRTDVIKLFHTGTKQSIDSYSPALMIAGDGVTLPATVHGRKLLSIIRNMGTDGLTPGKAIRLFHRETLDALNPDWHTQATTDGVVTGYSYDDRTPHAFYVKPAISASIQTWVEVAWIVQPFLIPNTGSENYGATSSDATNLSVDDEFLDDVVNYVCARAYMKISKYGDPIKAASFASLFTGSINAYATALTGVSPRLTTLPGA